MSKTEIIVLFEVVLILISILLIVGSFLAVAKAEDSQGLRLALKLIIAC